MRTLAWFTAIFLFLQAGLLFILWSRSLLPAADRFSLYAALIAVPLVCWLVLLGSSLGLLAECVARGRSVDQLMVWPFLFTFRSRFGQANRIAIRSEYPLGFFVRVGTEGADFSKESLWRTILKHKLRSLGTLAVVLTSILLFVFNANVDFYIRFACISAGIYMIGCLLISSRISRSKTLIDDDHISRSLLASEIAIALSNRNPSLNFASPELVKCAEELVAVDGDSRREKNRRYLANTHYFLCWQSVCAGQVDQSIVHANRLSDLLLETHLWKKHAPEHFLATAIAISSLSASDASTVIQLIETYPNLAGTRIPIWSNLARAGIANVFGEREEVASELSEIISWLETFEALQEIHRVVLQYVKEADRRLADK